MTDEIYRAFTEATPEAIAGEVPTYFWRRPLPKTMPYGAFVAAQWDMVRFAYAACDGALYPIVTLKGGGWLYSLKAWNGESVGDLMGRVQATARAVGADWMFLHRLVRAAPEPDKEECDLVVWMAGESVAGAASYRQGFFPSRGQTLGEVVEAGAGARVPDYVRRILEPEP